MVLLAMTPALVAAVKKYQDSGHNGNTTTTSTSSEPDLSNPEVGNSISHGQVIDISHRLKESGYHSHELAALHHLDVLLRGSHVYVAPARAKAQPTSEYKELMSRLRRQEEARAYDKMTAFQTQARTPFQMPAGSFGPQASDFADNSNEEDEMTFADVNRQMTLIINVLVSIIACGIAIWLVASHWSAPSRLALAMVGALAVGIAEVVIYAGYIRRLGEAKRKEKGKREKKSITHTWVIEKDKGDLPLITLSQGNEEEMSVKFRKGRRRK